MTLSQLFLYISPRAFRASLAKIRLEL